MSDRRDQQIYAKVCDLIQTPAHLQRLLARHAPGIGTDAATLEMVAEAVLSDDDQALDRHLIDTIIEAAWQRVSYH